MVSSDISGNEPQFVLCVTGQKDREYSCPKYWTGRMLESWPELLSDKSRAHVFSGKRVAGEVRSGFASRGFRCELEPA